CRASGRHRGCPPLDRARDRHVRVGARRAGCRAADLGDPPVLRRLATMTSTTPAHVTIDEVEGQAVVTDPMSGAERWRYAFGARKRPYVHPLTTPAGHVLTRNAPDDHPWHHGLWFTIKFVNEENFWEEYDSYGVLRHVG